MSKTHCASITSTGSHGATRQRGRQHPPVPELGGPGSRRGRGLIPQVRPSLVSSTHTRHQETQTQSKNAARPSRKPILALNSVNFLVPRTDELWGVKICRVVTSNAFVPCEFTDPVLSLLKLCCGEGCFPTKSLGAVDFAGLWSPGSFNSGLG